MDTNTDKSKEVREDEFNEEATVEIAPYLQDIFDDIDARSEWNDIDNKIIEYRGGKRGTKNKPYRGAPNPVENILDDITSNKTDIEISMVMNTPRLLNVIPISENCPTDLPDKVAQGLDTLMRYAIRFRMKKEVLNDTKNLRGFSVCKLIRTDHPKFGLIPDFEPIDPKDCIVPVDTQVPVSRKGERVVFILRLNRRAIKKRERTKKWRNTTELLNRFKKETDKGTNNIHATSTYDEDKDNTLKVKQKMIGINASDFSNNNIVIYEIFHYATKWDVKNDPTGRVKEEEACVSYICPDAPDLPLKIIPWKTKRRVDLTDEELKIEIQLAQLENRNPKPFRLEEIDKPWPAIQPRAENKSLFWYDVWGIGRKCMDNHIIATRLKKKKLIQIDFLTNPMFEDVGNGDINEQNIMPSPGKKLPVGIRFANMPPHSSQIDFDIDSEKRSASLKAGGGSDSQYSAQVSSSRKLQKTAAEVISQDARNATLSSASVDRFNDPDIELFEMMFEECRELKVKLPIIHNNKFNGFAPMDIYNYEYIFSPSTSQKNINPDIQFLKDIEAYNFAIQFKDMTPMRIYDSLKYVLARHDTFFTDILLLDPKEKGDAGEPPMYDLVRQMMERIQELGLNSQELDKEIEAGLKLAEENSSEINKVQEVQDKILQEHKDLKSNVQPV